MVMEKGIDAYFLRCICCPWDSRSVAIAPTAADLLLLLREHERAGSESVIFRERLAQFKKVLFPPYLTLSFLASLWVVGTHRITAAFFSER
jgi:hypothetical protein